MKPVLLKPDWKTEIVFWKTYCHRKSQTPKSEASDVGLCRNCTTAGQLVAWALKYKKRRKRADETKAIYTGKIFI